MLLNVFVDDHNYNLPNISPEVALQGVHGFRGCAIGGHGVIGVDFAKITPNFGFLAAFRGHS